MIKNKIEDKIEELKLEKKELIKATDDYSRPLQDIFYDDGKKNMITRYITFLEILKEWLDE